MRHILLIEYEYTRTLSTWEILAHLTNIHKAYM